VADNDTQPSAADENKIDHYVRLNMIASGKHAQVWEVQEENTSNRFAMKLLLPEAMTDPEHVATLKYEGKVAQSLDHPNLIKWFATVQRKTNSYLILELFRSPNLKTFLINDSVGVHTRLRKLVECTCLALQHMHDKGWAHLDVKPDNILLSRSSEVKVIDFSLSQRIKSGIGKLLGGGAKEIGGTLTYIAPETLRKEPLTAQTDIYSFGITLYECLTGTFPFKGRTPRDLMMKHLSAQPAPPSDYNKNVTPEMDRLVLRMLAKKPKDRHKSMQEVYSEFRNIQLFKEDPEKLMEEKVKDAKEKEVLQSLGKRLDSRTDASRSEMIKQNPEMARQFATAANPPPQSKSAMPPLAAPAAKSSPAKPPAAAPLMPPRPPMMPMPQPMGMPYPQQPSFMPMPQMPMPFAPMPGYFGAPPAAMPGYPFPPGGGAPMPGIPPMDPAAMMPNPVAKPTLPQTVSPPLVQPTVPAAPIPTSAQTPDAPAQPPASPAAPTPARPAAGKVLPRVLQRPAPPPVPQGVDDLPTMDELPEVM
jgi:serine/threonine protein kinase